MTSNGDTVEIPLREYQELLRDSLWSELLFEIVEDMPVGIEDLLEEDDPRVSRINELTEQIENV